MRALLTSAGISNRTIHDALVDLLGKPISRSRALIIPTAVHPFPGGPGMAWRAVSGTASPPLAGLGWQSLGILELTALPSIDRSAWVPEVHAVDALLVWGGDPLFLSAWMHRSGFAEVLPTVRPQTVYVGVSGGSMAACESFTETYDEPPGTEVEDRRTEDVVFWAPEHGEMRRTLVSGHGVGLVDFAIIPHLDHPDHPDASLANARRWAQRNDRPTYAIDDQTAVRTIDGVVDVVSEGHWELLDAGPPAGVG